MKIGVQKSCPTKFKECRKPLPMALQAFEMNSERWPANYLNFKWIWMNTSKKFLSRNRSWRHFWKHVHYLLFRLVIETLEKQERDKRCFRLVGGVLVERKVGEVEPALVNNREKVSKFFWKDNFKSSSRAGHRLNFAFLNVFGGFSFHCVGAGLLKKAQNKWIFEFYSLVNWLILWKNNLQRKARK